MSQARVRFIGSRELHRELPKVVESLEDVDSRYVLTIHSKPKAVLLGTEAFLELLQGQSNSDKLLAMQLGALVQGLSKSDPSESTDEASEAETEVADLAMIGI